MEINSNSNFIADCLSMKASAQDVDEYVEFWHTHSVDKPLKEFLGMTDSEFEKWGAGSDSVIEEILRSRVGLLSDSAVLMSLPAKICCDVANGRQTVLIKKNRPQSNGPFKVYIFSPTPSRKNDLGLCVDDGKIATVFRWNFDYARKHKMPIISGKVIGEFICKDITYLGNVATDDWSRLCGSTHEYHKRLVTKGARMTERELREYGGKYAWHISDLILYSHPKQLGDFSVTDTDAVKHCEYRTQVYCNERCESGYIKAGFVCNQKNDWCDKCKTKPIAKAPQSWCYTTTK